MDSFFQEESGKVDLSECTKLSVDERLAAPDPDMLGYRIFVVVKVLGHGEKSSASRKLSEALCASRPETWNEYSSANALLIYCENERIIVRNLKV